MARPGLTVISTAHNAARFARRCVESVARQELEGVTHLYLDAASTDATASEARAAGRTAYPNGRGGRLVFETQGPPAGEILENARRLVATLPPREIVAWLDGDDWLIPDTALSRIADLHADGALVTYGQFLWHDGSIGMAAPVGEAPRREPWRATHLKTFRAGLFQAIPEAYLRSAGGQWWRYAGDRAVMLALLDMARPYAFFVPEVLYFYNSQGYFAQTPDQKRAAALEVEAIHSQPPLIAWTRAQVEALA